MGLYQIRKPLRVVQRSFWVPMLSVGAVIMHDCRRQKAVGPYLRTKGACVVWLGPVATHSVSHESTLSNSAIWGEMFAAHRSALSSSAAIAARILFSSRVIASALFAICERLAETLTLMPLGS